MKPYEKTIQLPVRGWLVPAGTTDEELEALFKPGAIITFATTPVIRSLCLSIADLEQLIAGEA